MKKRLTFIHLTSKALRLKKISVRRLSTSSPTPSDKFKKIIDESKIMQGTNSEFIYREAKIWLVLGVVGYIAGYTYYKYKNKDDNISEPDAQSEKVSFILLSFFDCQ